MLLLHYENLAFSLVFIDSFIFRLLQLFACNQVVFAVFKKQLFLLESTGDKIVAK